MEEEGKAAPPGLQEQGSEYAEIAAVFRAVAGSGSEEMDSSASVAMDLTSDSEVPLMASTPSRGSRRMGIVPSVATLVATYESTQVLPAVESAVCEGKAVETVQVSQPVTCEALASALAAPTVQPVTVAPVASPAPGSSGQALSMEQVQLMMQQMLNQQMLLQQQLLAEVRQDAELRIQQERELRERESERHQKEISELRELLAGNQTKPKEVLSSTPMANSSRAVEAMEVASADELVSAIDQVLNAPMVSSSGPSSSVETRGLSASWPTLVATAEQEHNASLPVLASSVEPVSTETRVTDTESKFVSVLSFQPSCNASATASVSSGNSVKMSVLTGQSPLGSVAASGARPKVAKSSDSNVSGSEVTGGATAAVASHASRGISTQTTPRSSAESQVRDSRSAVRPVSYSDTVSGRSRRPRSPSDESLGVKRQKSCLRRKAVLWLGSKYDPRVVFESASFYAQAIKDARDRREEESWMRPMLIGLNDLRAGLQSIIEDRPPPDDISQSYFDCLIKHMPRRARSVQDAVLTGQDCFADCRGNGGVFGGRDIRYSAESSDVRAPMPDERSSESESVVIESGSSDERQCTESDSDRELSDSDAGRRPRKSQQRKKIRFVDHSDCELSDASETRSQAVPTFPCPVRECEAHRQKASKPKLHALQCHLPFWAKPETACWHCRKQFYTAADLERHLHREHGLDQQVDYTQAYFKCAKEAFEFICNRAPWLRQIPGRWGLYKKMQTLANQRQLKIPVNCAVPHEQWSAFC